MPRPAPDPLRELALLARTAEPGTTNLADYIASRAEELGPALHVTPKLLRRVAGHDDAKVAPRLRRWLERANSTLIEDRRARHIEASLRAAAFLGDTARWTTFGAIVQVDVLVGDLLADRGRRYIVFSFGARSIAIERSTLTRVTPLRRMFLDLAAFVNNEGLHFRWRGGRGGFNWKSRRVPEEERRRVLEVMLRAPRSARTTAGAWLGDVLTDLALLG